MQYMLKTQCFVVHESLKRDNKKENNERKNVKWRERIKGSSLRRCCLFRVIIIEKQYVWILICITSEFSFLNATNYFIFKIFPGDLSILVEKIFENERSWNQNYLNIAIQFSVIPKGFNNVQIKKSFCKILYQLAVSKLDSENFSLAILI